MRHITNIAHTSNVVLILCGSILISNQSVLTCASWTYRVAVDKRVTLCQDECALVRLNTDVSVAFDLVAHHVNEILHKRTCAHLFTT